MSNLQSYYFLAEALSTLYIERESSSSGLGLSLHIGFMCDPSHIFALGGLLSTIDVHL